ncbi:Nn.00g042380.m01.CDS01 [Neocucurbitaria sp. VM-36]
MYTHISTLTLLTALSAALPTTTNNPLLLSTRQSNPCFLIGTTALPAEVSTIATTLANSITCSTTTTTISNVPDVTSGSVTFSSIDFSQSSQTPLEFALSNFATASPLADTDLQTFKDSLDVYLATEAGVRSVGGSLAIKVPKFFLEMQVSRIETAQGNAPSEAGLQVEHLRDKVTKNAAGEEQALLDQVVALAAQLS